jgi:hypothetical protein
MYHALLPFLEKEDIRPTTLPSCGLSLGASPQPPWFRFAEGFFLGGGGKLSSANRTTIFTRRK